MKRNWKRMLALLLAIGMLALCACSAKTEQEPAAEQSQQAAANDAAQEAAPAQKPAEETPAEKPDGKDGSQQQQGPEAPDDAQETAQEAAEQTQTPQTQEAAGEESAPEEPQKPDGPLTCTISISCATILDNLAALDPEKVELVPEDGWILAPVTVEFTAGQNVFDVLLAAVKANAIHMEYQNTPIYETAYIEGIGNLYEFDCGELSGWMYRVNGWFPNYGCSWYAVQAGDVIEWMYTCDLGSDIGGSGVSQVDE